MTSQRPLPRLDSENRFFWTSGAEGVLRFLQCQDCSTFVHPPRPMCPYCLSENVAPAAVPGTGVVETYTVNRQKWHPAMEVPSIIARISIDGAPGVILTSNVINVTPETVAFGDRVKVVFQHQDDVFLPFFEKID